MTAQFERTMIALDPGFGNTKVAIRSNISTVQSVVARPRQIGRAGDGLKTAEVSDQVRTGSGLYVAGDGAWCWGEPLGGLDYGDLASEPRKALFYAALARIFPTDVHQADLVIGLPIPLLQDPAQAETVLGALRDAYKCRHEFSVNNIGYDLTIGRVQILAQPVGAWADWMLDEDLRQRKGGKDAEIAVLDIGMNTLDLFVVTGGRLSPRFLGGKKIGVRRLLERLNGHGVDMEELDAGLRANRLRPTAEILQTWLAEVLNAIEGVWPDLHRFTAVIPAGGGSLILGDLLRRALIDRGAAVAWPQDPIGANARGLWKWGAYSLSKAK